MGPGNAVSVRPLKRRSPLRWLQAVAEDWAIVVASVLVARWLDAWWTYGLAVIVVGTRQHALAILGHDGAHRAVSRNRRVNDTLTCLLCWWPLFIGLGGYRRFHFAHHRHLGTPRDPELHHKRASRPQWDLPLRPRRLTLYGIGDWFGLGVIELVRLARSIRPAGPADVLGPFAVWSTVVVGLYWLDALWVLPLWFGAIVTSFWAMFRLRVWTEHMGTAGSHRVSATWWQRWLFMPHNTWCHYEHHRWPSLPLHNLPAARILDRSVPIISVSGLLSSLRHVPTTPSGHSQPPPSSEPRLGELAGVTRVSS